jgi:hypothetical protein
VLQCYVCNTVLQIWEVDLLQALLLAVTLASTQSAAVGDSGSRKMICKNVTETRSRIRPPKVCLTEAQWNAVRRDTRQEWENRGSSGR